MNATVVKPRCPARKRGLVIFDGDDTLWETMPIYTAAKERFFQAMASWGYPIASLRRFFEELDVENVKHLGFSRHRFPDTMVRTYRRFCAASGQTPDAERERQVHSIGDQVFSAAVPLLPGARDALHHLGAAFYLALLTKGDFDVQHSRVGSSGLGPLFDEICICERKTASLLATLAERFEVPIHRTWVVGNSLKSDIAPAVEAGMHAVWVPYRTWAYEDANEHEFPGMLRCRSLLELPAVVNASDQ